MASVDHQSLNSSLLGVDHGSVWQFRGIRYGQIATRFARPQQVSTYDSVTRCTEYGPRCPQIRLDPYHLLRIPYEAEQEPEDEFDCLNLDVTIPAGNVNSSRDLLPVKVWIHGGSQTVTYGSASSRICDPVPLVEASVRQGMPFILVAMQYRLNVFAFGDGKGEVNLALQDQRLALEWVREHIVGFGGDPNRITLAGESAGAVYCHAHLVSGAQVEQAVLSSGSLYLSPPLPRARGLGVLEKVRTWLESRNHGDLSTCSAEALVQAQAELGINTLWLQEEPGLEGWQAKPINAKRILMGDTEYEAAIWRNGVETADSGSLIEVADHAGSKSHDLKRAYGLIQGRHTSCKNGALDLLMDLRFTLPTEQLTQKWTNEGRTVFRYLVDQANPWQPSSRAHHGVDLVLLFGGFDLSFNRGAAAVGTEMRKRWIIFINGFDPWDLNKRFAFGPVGSSGVIDVDGFAGRRRERHLQLLRELTQEQRDAIFVGLGAGRISLLN